MHLLLSFFQPSPSSSIHTLASRSRSVSFYLLFYYINLSPDLKDYLEIDRSLFLFFRVLWAMTCLLFYLFKPSLWGLVLRSCPQNFQQVRSSPLRKFFQILSGHKLLQAPSNPSTLLGWSDLMERKTWNVIEYSTIQCTNTDNNEMMLTVISRSFFFWWESKIIQICTVLHIQSC